ncbi:MAG: hypothetical protein AABZ02_01880 [Bacteroidota bacterium]
MPNNSAGTLVWTKYKEPPKEPDTKWIIETVRGAFSLPSEGTMEKEQTEAKQQKKKAAKPTKK